MLNNVSMKNDDDPIVLIEQISQIQNHFGSVACTIKDGVLIATGLAAAPSKYRSVLTTEQQIWGADWRMQCLNCSIRLTWSAEKGMKRAILMTM